MSSQKFTQERYEKMVNALAAAYVCMSVAVEMASADIEQGNAIPEWITNLEHAARLARASLQLDMNVRG